METNQALEPTQTLTTYKLAALNTSITLTLGYQNSYLTAFELQSNVALTQDQAEYLRKNLPWREAQVTAFKGFRVLGDQEAASPESVKGYNTNDKIRMFCNAFANKMGVSYKISAAETGMIASVPVTPTLLAVYFDCIEWWCNVKGVTNYCKNINQVQVLMANPSLRAGAKPKHNFPDEYDKTYEAKLNTDELQKYWQHLRDLGWTTQKDAQHRTVWKHPKHTH